MIWWYCIPLSLSLSLSQTFKISEAIECLTVTVSIEWLPKSTSYFVLPISFAYKCTAHILLRFCMRSIGNVPTLPFFHLLELLLSSDRAQTIETKIGKQQQQQQKNGVDFLSSRWKTRKKFFCNNRAKRWRLDNKKKVDDIQRSW